MMPDATTVPYLLLYRAPPQHEAFAKHYGQYLHRGNVFKKGLAATPRSFSFGWDRSLSFVEFSSDHKCVKRAVAQSYRILWIFEHYVWTLTTISAYEGELCGENRGREWTFYNNLSMATGIVFSFEVYLPGIQST